MLILLVLTPKLIPLKPIQKVHQRRAIDSIFDIAECLRVTICIYIFLFHLGKIPMWSNVNNFNACIVCKKSIQFIVKKKDRPLCLDICRTTLLISLLLKTVFCKTSAIFSELFTQFNVW